MERGEFARIPIDWNDATRTLTIGARRGTYPGVPASRTFTVVLVTHEADIARHARRVLTFRDGRLIADEPVGEPTDARRLLSTLAAEELVEA